MARFSAVMGRLNITNGGRNTACTALYRFGGGTGVGGQWACGAAAEFGLIRPYQFRAGEGAQDDFFAAHARFGLGLGAPLAQADAVAPAVAFGEADRVGFVDGPDEGALEDHAAGVDGPAEFLGDQGVLRASRVGHNEARGPAVLVGLVDV